MSASVVNSDEMSRLENTRESKIRGQQWRRKDDRSEEEESSVLQLQ